MKSIFAFILAFVVFGVASCMEKEAHSANQEEVDKNDAYELYLDSMWKADPEYFLDVIVETDEYQNYIANHEEWWKN